MRSVCVIVPIKRLALAKSRLAAHLPPSKRRALTIAMAEDVLRAVTNPMKTWSVAVVTHEPAFAARADELGAAVLPEPHGSSLAGAVGWAATTLARLGFARFAYVPADVPLIAPRDVAQLIGDHSDANAIRWAMAGRDGSIGALSWPAEIELEIPFGAGGAERLETYAAAAGVRRQRLELPHLALDLDTPEDLRQIALLSSASETCRLLDSWSRVA